MISIDIVHAISLIPLSIACFINDSRESTFLSSMTFFIMAVPIPPIFILESFSLPVPLGIIKPNIFSIKDFLTFCASAFLSTFNPQKVKNMVTGLPIAAAPFAMIKDANTLSRSPLNTISVFPCGSSVSSPFFTSQVPDPFLI